MAGRSGMASKIQTPYFAIEKVKLDRNLEILSEIGNRCEIKILHTLKALDVRLATGQIAKSLDGFSVANANEISKTEGLDKGHVHLYSPVYNSDEIGTVAPASDTMSFNSIAQYNLYAPSAKHYTSVGIRLNPNIHLKQPQYCDSSAASSRFGVGEDEFLDWYCDAKNTLEGIHIHIFCYQELVSMQMLLEHLRDNYDEILKEIKWLNLGGGLKLTDEHFDTDKFVNMMREFKNIYPNLEIILEPGEAVVSDCGYLECSVVDVVFRDEQKIAIVDASIETHLLDIAIVKLSPMIRESTKEAKGKYCYQITGISCIAGDIIGEYCFERELKIGDRLKIDDVIGYNICKQNDFNGIDKAKPYLV